MSNEQRTPDQITENELICERLLRWDAVRSPLVGTAWHADGAFVPTPRFTTWAEAGLILEAWTTAGNDYDIEGTVTEGGVKIAARLRQIKGIRYVGDFSGYNETTPLAIRAAALEYIRGQP